MPGCPSLTNLPPKFDKTREKGYTRREEVLSTPLVMVQNDKTKNNTLHITPPQEREDISLVAEKQMRDREAVGAVLTQGEILAKQANRITSESTVQTAKRTSPGTGATLSALLAKAK